MKIENSGKIFAFLFALCYGFEKKTDDKLHIEIVMENVTDFFYSCLILMQPFAYYCKFLLLYKSK